MDDILGWPPIFWTARIAALASLVGLGWVMLLYLARFFRPRHIRKLMTAELPLFRSFAGSAQILGQKIEASVTLDAVRDRQIERLAERVEELEERNKRTLESLRDLIDQVEHVRDRLPAEGA